MAKLRNVAPRLASVDTRIARPAPKTADPFYLSAAWRDLVERLNAERGRCCQQCGRTHNPDGSPVRIYGDHVRELKDGGAPLDANNVQLLDGRCHARKTAAARAARMAAVPTSDAPPRQTPPAPATAPRRPHPGRQG